MNLDLLARTFLQIILDYFTVTIKSNIKRSREHRIDTVIYITIQSFQNKIFPIKIFLVQIMSAAAVAATAANAGDFAESLVQRGRLSSV